MTENNLTERRRYPLIDVRAEDVDNEVLKKVVAAYQSPEVAQVIEEVYKGTVEPAFTY